MNKENVREELVEKASAEIFDTLIKQMEAEGPLIDNEIYAHIYRELSDKILNYGLNLDEQKYVIYKVVDFINDDKNIKRKRAEEVTVH